MFVVGGSIFFNVLERFPNKSQIMRIYSIMNDKICCYHFEVWLAIGQNLVAFRYAISNKLNPGTLPLDNRYIRRTSNKPALHEILATGYWDVGWIPATSIRWANAGLMLAHSLRRWPNINTALGQCPVFAGICPAILNKHETLNQCCFNAGLTLKTVGQH